MRLENLFENFDLLVKTPNGVQKLRELILQLSVQGKLMPQDPNDEPASVLLERIRAEKKRLIKEKKIKTSESLRPINVDKEVFDLPEGWEWVRLRDLGEFCGGMTPSTNQSHYWGGNIFWVSPKDMKGGQVQSSELTITELALKETRLRLLPKLSVLIVARSGILKRTLPVALNDVECAVNQDIKVLIPFDTDISKYIQLILRGHEQFILQKLVKGGMTVQSLKYDEFETYPFPLPPLAEQHRIIAKVDLLMAHCDELESRQEKQKAARIRINNTALDRLLSAREPEEFTIHWQRICENFDLLYDAPETVSQLRQAVLQLAVQGKLVAQDPNDEPARVLLEKIRAEKERLMKEKKSKGNEPISPVKTDEALYELPQDWEWVKINELTSLITDGEHATPPRITQPDVPLVTAKNVRDGFLDLTIVDYVSSEIAQKCWARCNPKHDDILMVCVGATTGRLTLLKSPPRFALVRSVALIRPMHGYIYPEFLALAIKSPIGQRQVWVNVKQSAQPCLYINKIQRLFIPLPPLTEQHRIVAKVDQFMALCDELETKLREAQAASRKLMTATVQHLGAV